MAALTPPASGHRPAASAGTSTRPARPVCVAACARPSPPPPPRTSRRQLRRSVTTAAAAGATYGTTPSIKGDEYVVLGLANCFEKDEEGKLNPRQVVEPVSANTLESLAAGAKTSYSEVWATTTGVVVGRDRSALPPAWAGAAFCSDWEPRLGAVARTWARPHAVDNLMDIVPLGQARAGWNTSTEDKRVLNFVAEVNDDDNIKQDISIDVYGRSAPDAEKVLGTDAPAAARAAKAKAADAEDGVKAKAAAEKKAAAPPPPPPAVEADEEEEDDLDALLNA